MKKFIKTIILMMIISFTLIGAEKVDAKTVSVNKSSVTVRAGSTAKVKVKNTKNIKVKISKKIAKVSVKDKTITIKAIKAGKAIISVKSPNMSAKKIKLTVKISDKSAEMKERSKMDGYGDKYKDDIEKYPYLDKKSFKNTSDIYKYSINQQWKAMPDYLRDCLAYNKTKIKFAFIEYGGLATGTEEIKIDKTNNKKEENLSIIHEAAHIYDHYMKDKGIDIKKKLKKLFQKDKYKYGIYGGSSLSEFYAESINNTILSKLKTIKDETIIEILLNNVEDIDIRYINDDQCVIVMLSSYDTPNGDVELGNKTYINSISFDDWDEYKENLLINYYKELYPDATDIRLG